MAKTARKLKGELENVQTTETLAGGIPAPTRERIKKALGKADTITSVDIRTKGEREQYIAWRLGQLPKDGYIWNIDKFDGGIKVRIAYQDDKQGNVFFICKYLACLVQEVRTLDESNLKVEQTPVISHNELED